MLVLSCEENSLDSNDIINWEGNFPNYNIAYKDSILFTSDRLLGRSFIPSVHIMYKDGSGMRGFINEWFTFNATWSPRKWKILFIADTSFCEPQRTLFMMDANGSNKKRILLVGEDVWYGRWSPEGIKILIPAQLS